MHQSDLKKVALSSHNLDQSSSPQKEKRKKESLKTNNTTESPSKPHIIKSAINLEYYSQPQYTPIG